MITDIENGSLKRRPLSWYKEQLQSCIERERLNHSYKRVTVLEMLYEMESPVSIEQLYFTLSREGGIRVSINTVYRIVKLLVSFDLVIRMEANGSPKYVLNAYDACNVTVYCRKKGQVLMIDTPGHWQFQLIQILQKKGVDISGGIEVNIDCLGQQ